VIRLALDAMGGDHAPLEHIKGALLAAREFPDLHIILVGDRDKLFLQLSRLTKKQSVPNITITHASEVIGMDEPPTQAIKQKKDSSINVAVGLVKKGEAQAIVSTGNTGALMAAALLGFGRIKGIERPAIAAIFPTLNDDEVLLLDMGANVDCKPRQLVQFALMGSVYAEHVMHKTRPRVALLSIGTEAEKGNELTTTVNEMLDKEKINFIGNIEGTDILTGTSDVIICDGFVGNVILKFAESMAIAIFNLLKDEMGRNLITRFASFLLLPAFHNLRKRIDYDEHGGALMLGLQNICIKAHGRAKAKAIKNALRIAREAVKEDVVGCMQTVGIA